MFAPGGLACMDCKTEVLNELFFLLLLLNINFFFKVLTVQKMPAIPLLVPFWICQALPQRFKDLLQCCAARHLSK